ncbi:hypothetical protein MWH14_21455 (plasmid) [Providencia stuartii]|uniref:hypothetical protein n=1 Tax=Providencia TaxID=586 RepID=UPI000A82CD52|nr:MULTISPECIES: hypothetical protein [Providencia]ELR5042640.1 hypothetical protein [Providencia rettgeri]URE81008.1 hypothetical protein MWH14_21455 [Providencia stuartii]URQ57515.1 Hypothetical protein [Providencia alcalifaciens]URQ58016.1 Hypothetical protein [Providencia rettgeri]
MKLNTLRFFSLVFTVAIAVMVIVFGSHFGIKVTEDFVIKVLLIVSMPIAFTRNKSKS